MYIIELFFKIASDIKSGKFKRKDKQRNDNTDKDTEKCDHFFVPIDSTGRILACSKCGEIYKLKKGEINPFK